MITKETAYRVVKCYQEIEAGEKLVATLKEANQRGDIPDLRDAFGRQRGLQLGVPSGDATRLYDVHPKLAAAVIRAHIAEKRAELEALNIQAWREAEGSVAEGVQADMEMGAQP